MPHLFVPLAGMWHGTSDQPYEERSSGVVIRELAVYGLP